MDNCPGQIVNSFYHQFFIVHMTRLIAGTKVVLSSLERTPFGLFNLNISLDGLFHILHGIFLISAARKV